VKTRDVFYLHGFASSPASAKAAYLAERFGQHRITLRSPDFNQPDFATLTITRMLDQLGREIEAASGPVALIGSSLGGTLAILAADRFARVGRLALLAPAVMFGRPGHRLFTPDQVDEWRRRGVRPVFHYADRGERPLNFGFYEDSVRYNAFDAVCAQPTLIVQGVRDTSVDHRTVEAFARGRRNVSLSLVDDDHQLMASLPRIWNELETFLELKD